MPEEKPVCYDYVIIGSGFGGSVSAMRLSEKGYRVLVLERGKRYEDHEFPKTNWVIWKFLWLPFLRCFGIFDISLLKGVLIFRGAGVGGGSLTYANVLMEPDASLFTQPEWNRIRNWKAALHPHYQTAKKMLGVTTNPKLWESDHALRKIAGELNMGSTFEPTQVGVFFNQNDEQGVDVPDPYFGGEGPPRRGCTHCGACMVGCRENAKNTLLKNYLYFAEKLGAKVLPEATVTGLYPVQAANDRENPTFRISFQKTTSWGFHRQQSVFSRNVVLSAGVLGTLRLLFHCRDDIKTMPDISQHLGKRVLTNSEALHGITSKDSSVDYSKGISITSIFRADKVTHVEPVRYPAGSSFIRLISAPLLNPNHSVPVKLLEFIWSAIRHPVDFLRRYVFPGWAQKTTILLVMQTVDNYMRLSIKRSIFTLFKPFFETAPDQGVHVPAHIEIAHSLTKRFAEQVNGEPGTSFAEALLNMPATAHIMGGCQLGSSAADGVVSENFELFNYPGVYVVDGSVIPGNPGVNPSLTITALAEYAMKQVEPKKGAVARKPIGKAIKM